VSDPWEAPFGQSGRENLSTASFSFRGQNDVCGARETKFESWEAGEEASYDY
jgi:hypothetical protein